MFAQHVTQLVLMYMYVREATKAYAENGSDIFLNVIVQTHDIPVPVNKFLNDCLPVLALIQSA